MYYPLELRVPDTVKEHDLENALGFMRKKCSGVMMGITLYQIVAAEIRNRSLFDTFFRMSFRPYVRGSFNVLAETPDNRSVNFLTGASGFPQQVLFGYTGLRITGEGLVQKYPPMLPEGVKSLHITDLKFRGKRYTVTVQNGTTSVLPQ